MTESPIASSIAVEGETVRVTLREGFPMPELQRIVFHFRNRMGEELIDDGLVDTPGFVSNRVRLPGETVMVVLHMGDGEMGPYEIPVPDAD